MAIVMATRSEIPPCMCLHMYMFVQIVCMYATYYGQYTVTTKLREGGGGGELFWNKATTSFRDSFFLLFFFTEVTFNGDLHVHVRIFGWLKVTSVQYLKKIN